MAGEFVTTSEDIAKAFARIEDDLLGSMMRNLGRHGAMEEAEGFQWSQWQAREIAELERYARRNSLRYGPEFDRLNARMDEAVKAAYAQGYADEEARMLEAALQGADIAKDPVLRLPEERMDAIVRATHDDMMRAEYATLRRSRDIYRKTIFDAQVYAASGATTYGKAIDMAVGDFLVKGIDGITYRNGSRHSIVEYSRMAVRTAAKRAALTAEGDARRDWGVHTVFVNHRADACPECMAWVGRVLVDDVYGGGTAEEARESGYPLLSEAMAQGLFHPNCRDTCSTYFEGISQLPDRPTKAERARAEAAEAEEQRYDAAALNAERYGRASLMALDMDDRRRYAELAGAWQGRADEAAVSATADIARALEGAGMRAEHAEAAARLAEGAGGKARAVFEDAAGELKLRKPKKTEAYYDPTNRTVTVNMDYTAAGFEQRRDKAAFQEFFHEFGHFIDSRATGYATAVVDRYRVGETISQRMGLGESVKKEVGDLLKRIKKENGFGSIAQAKDALTKEVGVIAQEHPEALGGLTDMIQGATQCSCCDEWYMPGHSKSYWKGAVGAMNLSDESFAHFYETTMANPEALETLKHYLPESYKLFLEILEAM